MTFKWPLKLFIALLLSTNQTWATDFGQRDKQLHLAATTGISSVAYNLSRQTGYSRVQSYFMAMSLASTVGLVKELSDKKYDQDDMQANVLGASLGPVLFVQFEF